MRAKRKTAKKRVARKRTVRKKTARTKRVSKKRVARRPSGYVESDSGILIPEGHTEPVPPAKLRKGLQKAKKEVVGMISDIIETMTGDYVIGEIELTASFDASGKFMGFGVGGAASIKIKIVPDRD